METLERLLAESPFFAGLDPEHARVLVGCAAHVRFEPGEFLCREGEPADNFYLIRHGRVTLELFVPQRGPVRLQTLDPGEVVGWSWLVEPYTWHFDARALEAVVAVSLDGTCLRNKCDADPRLGYELLKRFAHVMEQRLYNARLGLLDLYGVSA
jgi:CRP/FNR family transcriptional regulator, cyclic AMP receptor protein